MSANLHLVTNPCDGALDYVYGELSGAALEAFVAHLATCASCQATVASWGQVRAAVKELPTAELAETRAQAMHNQLMLAATQDAAARRTMWSRVRRVTNAPAMLAAMTILAVGGAIAVNWTRGAMAPAPAVTAEPSKPMAAPVAATAPAQPDDKPAPGAEPAAPPPLSKTVAIAEPTRGALSATTRKGGGAFKPTREFSPSLSKDAKLDSLLGAASSDSAGHGSNNGLVGGRLREDATLDGEAGLKNLGNGAGAGNFKSGNGAGGAAAHSAPAKNLDDAYYGGVKRSLGHAEQKAKKVVAALTPKADDLDGSSGGDAPLERRDAPKSKAAPRAVSTEDERQAAESPSAPAPVVAPVVVKEEHDKKPMPAKPSDQLQQRGQSEKANDHSVAQNAAPTTVPPPVQAASGYAQQANGPPVGGAPSTPSASTVNSEATGKKQQSGSLLDRADALADAGQCDAAQKLFVQAKADDSTRGKLAQVRCLRRTGRYRQAQASLNALKTAQPAAAPKIAVEQQSLDAAEKSAARRSDKAKAAAPAAADTQNAY